MNEHSKFDFVHFALTKTNDVSPDTQGCGLQLSRTTSLDYLNKICKNMNLTDCTLFIALLSVPRVVFSR